MSLDQNKYQAYMFSEHKIPRFRAKYKKGILDDLHFNTTKIDGTKKPFRFAVSPREAGKSTTWLKLYQDNFRHDKTVLCIRRLGVDITEIFVNDIENLLNKFLLVPVKLFYAKGDMKAGVVDVYIAEMENASPKPLFHNKRLFFRVIALSLPMNRIKSLLLPSVKYFFFDEFICNLRLGEKYIQDEAFKFKEMYNTFQREAKDGIVCYFFGNPYSVFNPYFEWLGVDTGKIRAGAFIVGNEYVIECYQLKEELKKKILEKNPIYKFDDSYTKYAFDGKAINDENIKLGNKPTNSHLKFVFKVSNRYYGYYSIPLDSPERNMLKVSYYCEELNWNPEYKRIAFCFDFNDLGSNSSLLQQFQKETFFRLRYCIANNMLLYKTVSCEYITEFIYMKL